MNKVAMIKLGQIHPFECLTLPRYGLLFATWDKDFERLISQGLKYSVGRS